MTLARTLIVCLSLVASGTLYAAAPAPVKLPETAAPAAQIVFKGHGEPVRLGFVELESLGTHQVATATFWPEDDGTYSGPLLADVLKRAGLDGATSIRVRARDGFSQVIPRADWTRWPVVLATRRDGKIMSPRNKGPYRIIYPRNMSAELADPIYRLRWVWLIESIEAATDK